MEKIDYEKLNRYLNDVFLTLSKYDSFFIDNILRIARINDEFLSFIDKFDLTEETKETKLTYDDVFVITRRIIASIDSSYLNDYDSLISTGKLDFGYDKEYKDSCFVGKEKLININREFNFNDILTLVHEFIHYTNGKEKLGKNRYLLTEFFSIYFELNTLEYLLEQGVPKDQIGTYDRLRSTLKHAETLYRYEILFLAYEKFGHIDERTAEDLKGNLVNISKEEFEKDCRTFLDYVDRKETKYNKELPLGEEFNKDDLIYEICAPFYNNYRYILGTILAYYARENCKQEEIVYLNNHINDDNIDKLPLSNVLKTIGIDIHDKMFITKSLDSIENFIKQNKKEKAGGL